MTVKMVESSIGCYYRSQNKDGEYFGGPSYCMARGIAGEKGLKIGTVLAALFGISFMFHSVSGLSVFNISDALYASLNIPRLVTAGGFSLFLLYIIWKGVPRISKFSVKMVPFMCMIYLLAGIIIIIMHIQNVPAVFAQIFHDAFTGTAATGGFVGVGVMTVVRTGIARSINSNEAGQGSSPMIHSSADTIHPIRQGMWGCTEVFVDTIIVCTVTALSIRPAALMRGASMKPMEEALRESGSQPHSFISAAKPGRVVRFRACSPRETNTRFSPTRGMTSATVPRHTMSAYSRSISSGLPLRAHTSLKASATPDRFL